MEETTFSSQDQSLIFSAEAEAYKPNSVQRAIAVTLCGATLLNVFIEMLGQMVFSSDYEFYVNYQYYGNIIWNSVYYLLLAICFWCLNMYANNKATKIALILGIVYFLLRIIVDYFDNLGYLFFLNEGEQYIPKVFLTQNDYGTPQPTEATNMIYNILRGFNWVLCFIPIYIYGLVLTNNRISSEGKKWINMLIVVAVTSVFFSPLFQTFCRQIMNEVSESLNQVVMFSYSIQNGSSSMLICSDYYNNTLTFKIIRIVVGILLSLAYYHFARCEAFSGNYDTNIKCKYSPLNKYVAAAIIVSVIITFGIYMLYSNYKLFI